MPPAHRFLVSAESEYLTVVEPFDQQYDTVQSLIAEVKTLVPSVPGPLGVFTPYGRVYLDGSHLEFAAAECSSPFTLVQIMEAMQRLARSAASTLRTKGADVVLANNNHSGLLTSRSPSWGSHSNFLVDAPPKSFADRVIPFLATQVYAGAGGLHHPSGRWVAGARMEFLRTDRGGDTMHLRALHSTSRDEHLTENPKRFGYRYHLIHHDGLRSQYSQILRLGTLQLVLHALFRNVDGIQNLPGPTGLAQKTAFWLQAAKHFNTLSQGGEAPRAHPLAIEIQWLYVRMVEKALAEGSPYPPWCENVLTLWIDTLHALARDDREWLSARLDAWIKFELVRAAVDRRRVTWGNVGSSTERSAEMALLCQQYHEFTNPGNDFDQLSNMGLLAAPLLPVVEVGNEPEPFVPDFGTRATARARFLVERASEPGWRMDWSHARNVVTGEVVIWDDPCNTETEAA